MDKHFITGTCLRACAGALGLFIAICALSLSGCTSPEAIAAFAGSAQKVLQQSPAIFTDIHDSCVRRHLDARPITPLYLPSPSQDSAPGSPNESPVCAPFGPQGQALTKASDVLAAYFEAIEQLAAFNTSSVGTTSLQAAEYAATAAQLSTTQIDSVGKLAGLVTQAFTEHYRQSHLVKYLREADPSISSVTQGFEDIVAKDYEGLLREERQTITARYQNVGTAGNNATILLLNRAYTDDLNELHRRAAAADAYVEALEQIRAGHHQLAQNAGHLHAKELSLALQPYTAKLQALVPVLQKGF